MSKTVDDVASLDARGTPLGWAHHYLSEGKYSDRQYAEIATYLGSRDRDG